MNLLKTDEVFFIGLATTAAVKKQKNPKKQTNKQSIIKDIMIRSNIRNNKKNPNKLQTNNLSKQVCITL